MHRQLLGDGVQRLGAAGAQAHRAHPPGVCLALDRRAGARQLEPGDLARPARLGVFLHPVSVRSEECMACLLNTLQRYHTSLATHHSAKCSTFDPSYSEVVGDGHLLLQAVGEHSGHRTRGRALPSRAGANPVVPQAQLARAAPARERRAVEHALQVLLHVGIVPLEVRARSVQKGRLAGQIMGLRDVSTRVLKTRSDNHSLPALVHASSFARDQGCHSVIGRGSFSKFWTATSPCKRNLALGPFV